MSPRTPHVPAALRRGPFLGSEARRRGMVTTDQLRSGCWRRLLTDVYVHAGIPDSPGLWLRAATLLLPDGGAFSGATAALVHGADIRRPDGPVELTLPRCTPMAPRAGLRIRRAELLGEDVRTVADLPVTTPLRTGFDLARQPAGRGDLTEHLVAADALTHLGTFSPTQLADYANQERFAGWRGVRQVTTVVGHTEPRTESPGETRVRMRIVLAGLPRPHAQVDIFTEDGVFVARADLAYPELGVAIEYDGECHETTRVRDAARRNRMGEAGWQVYVYTARDLSPGDDTIVRQVSALFG